jgi:hypothetical protein
MVSRSAGGAAACAAVLRPKEISAAARVVRCIEISL